jgi:hypothetical protein
MVASDSDDCSASTADNNQLLVDDIDDEFFLLMHLCSAQRYNFRRQLHLTARRRRDRRIPRIALQDPHSSAWVRLFTSNSDQALITFVGLDYRCFNYLNTKFKPLYDRYSPYSSTGRIRLRRVVNGVPVLRRPLSMDSRGCLGLVCSFTRTRGSLYALQLVFGLTGSVLSLFLRYGRRLLLRVLKAEPGSRIQMPSIEEIRDYQEIVWRLYPSLNGVWFVMDGLKLYLQQCGVGPIQACFYNGWQHDHYVSNIFAFAPSGLIVCCSINAPGCMHDSSVADYGKVYDKLEQQYVVTGGKGVVDSAFSRRRHGFLIKSSQTVATNAPRRQVLVQRDATSLRQTAEWGMRGFQGSFPRLKDRFMYEETGERMLMLLTTVHLYNFRTRYVGLNQIRSVFLPHLETNTGNEILGWNNLI